jgi:ribosome-associated protein YbcJ (S4-like RNA binding protein)
VGEIVKKEILIAGPYMTLGQLLKEEAIISSGGQAK